MDIAERINKHEQKKPKPESPSAQPPQLAESPSASQTVRQATVQTGTMGSIDPDKVELRPKEDLMKQGADWRSLDYDAAIKYNPQLSRSQYISGAAQYRKENNQPGFSDEEIFHLLGGKDPFISAEQEKKDERRMKAAGYIDSIGNVLANLVNYVRTTQGNPAMNLSSLKGNTARLDKLRAYHDALGRSNYAAYMNMLQQQRAREAAQAAAERKFMQEITLQNIKQNSPLVKAQVAAAAEKIETERAKREGVIADTEYKRLQAEGQAQENKFTPSRNAAELKLIEARTNAANQVKKQKTYPKVQLSGGQGKSRSYDLNNETEVVKLYNEIEKIRNLDPEERPKTIRDMREFILTTMNKKYANLSGASYAEHKEPTGLGWGKSNDNAEKLDW